MLRRLNSFLILGLLIVSFSANASTASADQKEKIHEILVQQHENGQFNGSILVAREGNVLYRNAFGESDGKNKPKLDPAMPSNLASVSKQFTAMAIMILAEEGRLNYDDPAAKYIPKLAAFNNAVTVRHLLTHTSGIPDVGDLGIDRPKLRQGDVLASVIKQQADFRKPGEKYRYSNTGYMLLAMIVEKASGMPFDRFLQQRIFDPLEMRSTSLPGGSGVRAYPPGSSGMYSTVDDLLKWDQALYSTKLVRQSTLDEAFTPAKVNEGTSTYGFGWNSAEKEGARYVWHTGNTDNYRAYIGRELKEKLTVIILTQKGNSRRIEISEAIFNILRGKPYAMPKLSVTAQLRDTLEKHGLDAALEKYNALKASHPNVYDFSESELNSLGYQLLDRGNREGAIRVFELNTIHYPNSSNAFDSLGEAYQRSGKKALAKEAYEKAIKLDPDNVNARKMLRGLE